MEPSSENLPFSNMKFNFPAASKKMVEKENDGSEEEEEEEGNGEAEFLENGFKKKKLDVGGGGAGMIGGSSGGGRVAQPLCQVADCEACLTGHKLYYQKHRVCEVHAKAPVVIIGGINQRFCQQCSRFHELSEFDQTKRSCRRRLAGHNERRRKTSSSSDLASNRRRSIQLKDNQCRQTGGTQIAVHGNKNYHIH